MIVAEMSASCGLIVPPTLRLWQRTMSSTAFSSTGRLVIIGHAVQLGPGRALPCRGIHVATPTNEVAITLRSWRSDEELAPWRLRARIRLVPAAGLAT
jgi:hypothetical protein